METSRIIREKIHHIMALIHHTIASFLDCDWDCDVPTSSVLSFLITSLTYSLSSFTWLPLLILAFSKSSVDSGIIVRHQKPVRWKDRYTSQISTHILVRYSHTYSQFWSPYCIKKIKKSIKIIKWNGNY